MVSEGVHPGVVSVMAGGGHRAGSRTALGHAYRSPDPDTARLPSQDGPVGGANPMELLSLSLDPRGRGIGRGARIVAVRRARGGKP